MRSRPSQGGRWPSKLMLPSEGGGHFFSIYIGTHYIFGCLGESSNHVHRSSKTSKSEKESSIACFPSNWSCHQTFCTDHEWSIGDRNKRNRRHLSILKFVFTFSGDSFLSDFSCSRLRAIS